MSLIKITQNKTKDENQRNVLFPLDNRHFITVICLLYGAFIYMIHYHVATVDKKSYNGYEVVMQSVGSPLFFSSADGRLLLKKE